MLSERQETILNIVKEQSPITGQHIAAKLHVCLLYTSDAADE